MSKRITLAAAGAALAVLTVAPAASASTATDQYVQTVVTKSHPTNPNAACYAASLWAGQHAYELTGVDPSVYQLQLQVTAPYAPVYDIQGTTCTVTDTWRLWKI
ncbi:hypothetical protein [Microbispora sp. ATCC PTA-5024]|uniref:hypothetical protein n=1 Tax=Microbispora sp. ATCC PTA-5024 TaxID=316330 RepID=UPI0003DDA382|nr:hypothetical protein [Microbispora sp. ATCC PTA-5024]ETK32819.1 hypothetical protein MPTA5024_27725 [Microbispora sp. ATCC PTA-5024]